MAGAHVFLETRTLKHRIQHVILFQQSPLQQHISQAQYSSSENSSKSSSLCVQQHITHRSQSLSLPCHKVAKSSGSFLSTAQISNSQSFCPRVPYAGSKVHSGLYMTLGVLASTTEATIQSSSRNSSPQLFALLSTQALSHQAWFIFFSVPCIQTLPTPNALFLGPRVLPMWTPALLMGQGPASKQRKTPLKQHNYTHTHNNPNIYISLR